MSDDMIKSEPRTEFGKGAARRIRREGKVPAVVYELGDPPIHLTLPAHATMLAIRDGGANAVLNIDIDGESQLALTKHVQSDPIKGHIEHVDFMAVKKGEKVIVEVPIEIVGEAAPDTLVVTEATGVNVEAEATHIPDVIEVSIQGAEPGTLVHAGDLQLPAGTTLLSDPEDLLINITHAPTAADIEAELGEGEEGDAADAAVGAEAPAEEA